MAVTTKKQFAATTNATTTVFSPVSIQLNNQDDLDVYVTLSGGTRVLQLRQSTGSTAQSSHPQVNNTDGLYFPAVSAGTTLYNYTLSSDNNTITFNSALPSGAVVFCERRTRDADSAYTSFASGSTIRATDLNNSSTESNFTAQDARNKALDLEGSIFGGVQPSINGVAQPFVNSSKIIDGSIATANIANNAITTDKLANNAVNNAKLADNSVSTSNIVANAVTTAKLADNAVTTAKITDGNVTTAKIADDAITNAKIADNVIGNSKMVNNSINTNELIDNAVTTAKIADNAVTTAKIADSNITTAKINDSAVTTAKLANNAVNNAKLADNSVSTSNIVANAVTTSKIPDSNVTTAKINDSAVTTAKIAADAIDGTKIADNAIGVEHLEGNSVDTNEIIDSAVTSSKIANNAVTTDKIADGDLKTLAGMQSATASKLADSTALTADIADLNQIDGMQKATTVTDDDTKFPTSGAIVDYVAAQLEPFGGFEAIANESSFPNTQPVSGVCVSIADVGGLAVSSTGTASGATTGGTTVNISGIPSNFRGTTVSNGVRFIVVSTGSSQNYTYHKATLKEDDLANLSGDINDFSERYRVGSSNPTTSLDNGDLFFNTSTGKLLVYNGTNTAWEEAQSIGNFFISTLSPAFNGSTQDFTITNAPNNAQQIILSINGVVQKPNAGTSTPSEGFALSGSTIKLSAAPATGSTYHAVVMGSTVNIGTPSDNTVTTAILQNGSVTTAKIADNSISAAKLTSNSVTTAKLVAGAVTSGELAANSVNTGNIIDNAVTRSKLADDSVGSSEILANAITASELANNAVETAKIADDAVTAAKIADNAINSTSMISGALIGTGQITNSAVTGAKIADGTIGTSKIADDQITAAKLANTSVTAGSYGSSTSIPSITIDAQGRITAASGNSVNTDLVGDTSPQLGGDLDTNSFEISLDDAHKVKFGNGNDLTIQHSGNHAFIDNLTGNIYIRNDGSNDDSEIHIMARNDEESIVCQDDGSVDLYHNGSIKFSTQTYGIDLKDQMIQDCTGINSGDQQIRMVVPTGTSGGFRVLTHYQDGNLAFSDNIANFYSTGIEFLKDVSSARDIVPHSNNSYDLGTSATRWQNIYTNDLHLSNKGSSNEVDGTWGDWTIQEGESDLFLKNNRSGKKYKFNLTEVS